MAPVLSVSGLTKSFGATVAVDHVSLDVGANECLALLGPSGCGKTTLLRLMAGLDVPDAGAIVIDGADMTRTPPYGRPVNMMFQSYALFPHMTVADNIAFGLKQEGLPPAEIETRLKESLAAVEMEALAARKPHQLSGGQRQRVALARCIAKRPKALLLDEPMAALDKHLRERTQLELLDLRRRLGISFVIVTHDQDEAMAMADRIALMDRGRILQVDTPRALYEQPASRTVARFFGDLNLWPSGLAVRPERIALSRTAGDIEGTVSDVIYRGTATTYLVQTADLVVRVLAQNSSEVSQYQKGERVRLGWPADAARMLPP
jgi:putrescine transport system ATP-binding protein